MWERICAVILRLQYARTVLNIFDDELSLVQTTEALRQFIAQLLFWNIGSAFIPFGFFLLPFVSRKGHLLKSISQYFGSHTELHHQSGLDLSAAVHLHYNAIFPALQQQIDRLFIQIGPVFGQIAIFAMHLSHERKQQRILRQLLQMRQTFHGLIQLPGFIQTFVPIPALFRSHDSVPSIDEILNLFWFKQAQLNNRKGVLRQMPVVT